MDDNKLANNNNSLCGIVLWVFTVFRNGSTPYSARWSDCTWRSTVMDANSGSPKSKVALNRIYLALILFMAWLVCLLCINKTTWMTHK